MRRSSNHKSSQPAYKICYWVAISLGAAYLCFSHKFSKGDATKSDNANTAVVNAPTIDFSYLESEATDRKPLKSETSKYISEVVQPFVSSSTFPTGDDCSTESIWCCSKTPIHTKSFYGFPDLIDNQKWLESCRIAASGQQILLPNILKTLTSPYDFIDGDTSFHGLHKQTDEFLDSVTGFAGRMKSSLSNKKPQAPVSYGNFYHKTLYTQQNLMNRVPILMSGFIQYTSNGKDFLRGMFKGFKGVSLIQILRFWGKQKNEIDKDERFILITALNENWGFLSTHFPNRTKAWGRVDVEKMPTLMNFLDDPRLLMLVVNQHSNISHPKILTIPRGLPDAAGFTNHAGRMLHDTMRLVLELNTTKSKLLFSVSSAFGTRRNIVNCVQKNVPSNLFDTSGAEGVTLLARKDYLLRAAGSRFALAPPGLGYDTFRLWEMMNLGTIPVIEKSIGFDRMVYRMPCLLVEDFAMITPEMLRDAYIEAVYRAEEFEYKRLTQTYWSDLVFQVSVRRSIDFMLERHPMVAEDPTLKRPMIAYKCSNLNGGGSDSGCGPGTMRPPRETCEM